MSITELLELFTQYTLDNKTAFTSFRIYRDGSGEILNGDDVRIASFVNISELITILSGNIREFEEGEW